MSLESTWITKAITGFPVDWPENIEDFADQVSKYAADQGVASLLHHRLYPTETWQTLPQDLREVLIRHTRHRAAHELVIHRELTRLLQEFTEQGLCFLVFKGTALAYNLYPAPHLRERCDTDIVFSSEHQAEQTWRLLQAHGYIRPNAIYGGNLHSQFACYRNLHGVTGVSLDIHWKLNNNPALADANSFEKLMQRAVKIPALGDNIATPCSVDAITLACLHRAAHRKEDRHNRLIWLYDLVLLLDQLDTGESADLVRQANTKHIGQIVADGIIEACKHFHTTPPEDLLGRMDTTSNQRVSMSAMENHWKQAWQQIKHLKNRKERTSFVRTNLLPPSDYMLKKYNTKNYTLLPWLYTKRIIEGIGKKIAPLTNIIVM